ncbi:hypothetical protein [Cellulomonas alba]|uniref:Uncharacterized protein n=1 Tax=Cellulomonas alba TaxID=3053467 RepID=A0ABT7SK01_9CELL|nr:hypothetical protein [Cellulomonas alba]MDM7856511.1 hypothetical protein [Cellulomonas alba]
MAGDDRTAAVGGQAAGAAVGVAPGGSQDWQDEERQVDERMTLADGPANGPDAGRDQEVARAHEPAAEAATSTGDAAVDEALTLLSGLDEQPLRAHVAAFDAVHGALQDRLADAEG